MRKAKSVPGFLLLSILYLFFSDKKNIRFSKKSSFTKSEPKSTGNARFNKQRNNI